jgi:hypothetical protein
MMARDMYYIEEQKSGGRAARLCGYMEKIL